MTLSADSLVLRNSYLLCEYERTTSVDPNCTGMGTTVGLTDVQAGMKHRQLERVFNMYGQEVDRTMVYRYSNQVLVFLYNDGSAEKKFISPDSIIR